MFTLQRCFSLNLFNAMWVPGVIWNTSQAKADRIDTKNSTVKALRTAALSLSTAWRPPWGGDQKVKSNVKLTLFVSFIHEVNCILTILINMASSSSSSSSSNDFKLWHCFGQPQISSGTWKARPADAKVESHLLEHLRHLSCRSVNDSPQPKRGPIYTHQCHSMSIYHLGHFFMYFLHYCVFTENVWKCGKCPKMTVRSTCSYIIPSPW